MEEEKVTFVGWSHGKKSVITMSAEDFEAFWNDDDDEDDDI